jgi:hypothetical protein
VRENNSSGPSEADPSDQSNVPEQAGNGKHATHTADPSSPSAKKSDRFKFSTNSGLSAEADARSTFSDEIGEDSAFLLRLSKYHGSRMPLVKRFSEPADVARLKVNVYESLGEFERALNQHSVGSGSAQKSIDFQHRCGSIKSEEVDSLLWAFTSSRGLQERSALSFNCVTDFLVDFGIPIADPGGENQKPLKRIVCELR